MSAPFLSQRKRRPDEIRRATVLGKTYAESRYRPQFALGIVCRDEADQQRLFKRLTTIAGGRELKVLVI